MYEQSLGLTDRPFTSTPYVKHYFAADAIHHSLNQAKLCIERGSGPVMITGPSGTGKSLLLALLHEQYKDRFKVTDLFCSNMKNRLDLLQMLLFGLGQEYRNMSEGELRLSLIDFLKTNSSRTNGLLILADEAHCLDTDLLDELRSITNFAQNGRPLVSLVMAGMPSLEEHLIDTKSESFNQRIAARCYLSHMSSQETIDYVLTHIERNGGNAEHLFTAEALNAIHKYTDGCPRLINQLADYALLITASQNASRVTMEIVTDAWNDVQSLPGGGSADGLVVDSKLSEAPVGLQDSDELMVIEFGQLQDDGHEIENTDIVVTASPEPAVELFEPNVCDESDHQTDSRYDTEDSTKHDLQIKQFDYSIAEEEVESSGIESSDMPREVPADFEDPFSEQFDKTELVPASFIPVVSEQNLNALMVTSQELDCLESIDTIENSQLKPIVVSYSSEETNERSDNKTRDAIEADRENITVEAQVHSHDDLKLSVEGLHSLEQVESDIRKLQRDLRFNERQFTSVAVHPDFALHREQPMEELIQKFPAVNEGQQAENSTGTHPTDPSGQDKPEVIDDRDMMVISQPESFRRKSIDLAEHANQVSNISTGVAKRMDYKELFQQLRNAE